MAGSKKVVRRRFVFTVTVRDVILLLLVVVLAAGVYIGWRVFDEYRKDKEIQKLDLKQQLIEKSKNEAIKKKEPKKELDIP
jgi:predicted negative regulator of RcsB-dependent stress response